MNKSNQYYYLFLWLIIVSAGCSRKESTPDISSVFEYNWGDNASVIIEKGFFHSPKKLDTLLNVMTGDTLLPIQVLPTGQVIVQKHIPQKMDLVVTDSSTTMVIIETGYVKDTLSFEVINLESQSFLVLFSNKTGSQILKSTDRLFFDNPGLPKQQPKISLAGLKIGEAVDPSKIKVIAEEQFGPVNTKFAVLLSDEDIRLRLKQGFIIDQIERMNIPERETKKLMANISIEFGTKPEIFDAVNEIDIPPTETTTYHWNNKEVSVALKYMKTIPWQEDEEPTENWSLVYSNSMITNILETFYQPEGPGIN